MQHISLDKAKAYPFRFLAHKERLFMYDMLTNRVLYLPNINPLRLTVDKLVEIYMGINGKDVFNQIESKKLSPEEYYNYLLQRESRIADKNRELCIELTSDCNLRCDYCPQNIAYSRTDKKQLDESPSRNDAVKHAIDWLFSVEAPTYSILLYGGEPLLEFDRIKEVVSYADRLGIGRDIRYFLFTNGTLLRKEYLDYCIARNFRIYLSLDGDEELHNAHRAFPSGVGSYNLIRDNLLSCIAHHRKYYSERIAFACVVDNESKEASHGDRIRESIIYHDNYIVFHEKRRYNEDLMPANIELIAKVMPNHTISDPMGTIKALSVIIENKANCFDNYLHDKIVLSGMCLPQQYRLFIDADGRRRVCARGTLSAVISEGNGEQNEQMTKQILAEFFAWLKKHCYNCVCSRICGSCYAVFHDYILGRFAENTAFCSKMYARLDAVLSYYIKESYKKGDNNEIRQMSTVPH